MYRATTIGFSGGTLAVVGTMLAGGHIEPFILVHGFPIVFVGVFLAVMFTVRQGLGAGDAEEPADRDRIRRGVGQ